jgi:peptidoglycan hydrolase-like protein with peptidoglycan-binding domain
MASTGSDLTPGAVFAILLSLALVGGATIYYIKRKDEREPEALPPHPTVPPHRGSRYVQQAAPSATTPPRRMMPPPQAFRQQPPTPAYQQPVYQPPQHVSPPSPAPAHQWTQPPTDDIQHTIAQLAAMLRTSWQHDVDDITVLKTAMQNPSLPREQRQMARQLLIAAHIDIHVPRGHHAPQQQAPDAHAQQPYARSYPTYMQPPPAPAGHQTDVMRPWQDLASQFGSQLGHWAHDVESWLQHPGTATVHVEQPAQQPVTYTPYAMPQPEHHDDAATQDTHAPFMRGPTFWSDTARRTGLIKPGDRLITVAEAQHYMNTIGMGTTLPENGVLDEPTHEAIRAFQIKHHLPITGNIDAETSSAMLYGAFVSATPQVINPGF